MFSKVKKADEKKKLIESLKYIVAQTLGPAGLVRAPREVADKITKYEPTFVEVQGGDADALGNVIMRATALGIAAVNGNAVPPTEAAPADKPTFKLDKGIALPESKRGGVARADIYPFAQMEKNDSFFIAATEAKPDPAKSLASTITAANRRFATTYPAKKGKNPHPQAGQPTGKDGRRFVVRPRTLELHQEVGARVWRTV